jgi:hypothetical protein|tara:strand:- start:296 stop:481 length:186 start_codon:yes stop_codon:yes gene_type:complete
MQLSKNTSTGKIGNLFRTLIKVTLFLIIIFVVVTLLNKIDFPSPNKEKEKIISNEKLKIVK